MLRPVTQGAMSMVLCTRFSPKRPGYNAGSEDLQYFIGVYRHENSVGRNIEPTIGLSNENLIAPTPPAENCPKAEQPAESGTPG